MFRQGIFLCVLSLAVSCKQQTSDPELILQADRIEITVDGLGCFSAWSDFFLIERSNEGGLISYQYQDSVTREARLTPEKEEVLAELVRVGLSGGFEGLCTSQVDYTIETPENVAFFVDGGCSGSYKLLDKLVGL